MRWFLLIAAMTTACLGDIIETPSETYEGTVFEVNEHFVRIRMPGGSVHVLQTSRVSLIRATEPDRFDSLRLMLEGTKITLATGRLPQTVPAAQPAELKLLQMPRMDALFEAGGRLQDARTLHFWGLAAGIVGTLITDLTVVDMVSHSERDHRVGAALGVGMLLTSFITEMVAWHRVGEAGVLTRHAVLDDSLQGNR